MRPKNSTATTAANDPNQLLEAVAGYQPAGTNLVFRPGDRVRRHELPETADLRFFVEFPSSTSEVAWARRHLTELGLIV